MKSLKVYYVPHNELCSVNIYLPIGQAHDPSHLIGITHLVEHLLFHSHPLLTQEELMAHIEEMGGIFNAVTEREMTVIYGRIHKKYVNQVLTLFKEAISNLKNSLHWLENERKIVLQELKTSYVKPYIKMMLHQHQMHVFPSHPYGQSEYLHNNIEDITKENIETFISQYGWDAWKILIVGGISEHEIEPSILPIGKISSTISSPTPINTTKVYEYVGIANGVYVSVMLEDNISDLDSMILLNALFRGLASPYYSKVVKEHGLSYSIEANISKYEHCRLLEFGWICKESDVERSKELLFHLIEQFKNGQGLTKQHIKMGLEKTRTEVLLIKENFIRYSNHLTKHLTLDSFHRDIFHEEIIMADNYANDLMKKFHSLPMIIGIHQKV